MISKWEIVEEVKKLTADSLDALHTKAVGRLEEISKEMRRGEICNISEVPSDDFRFERRFKSYSDTFVFRHVEESGKHSYATCHVGEEDRD